MRAAKHAINTKVEREDRMAIFQAVRGILLSTTWMLALFGQGSAQTIPGGICKMASGRTTEIGCWVIADQLMGQLSIGVESGPRIGVQKGPT
jgi:hypothetical protein